MCDPDDLVMMLAEGMMFLSIMSDDEDEDDEDDMDPCSSKASPLLNRNTAASITACCGIFSIFASHC